MKKTEPCAMCNGLEQGSSVTIVIRIKQYTGTEDILFHESNNI